MDLNPATQTTPSAESSTEPVVFGTAVEALIERALRGRLDAETLKGLHALKVDPDHLQVAYDYKTWLAVVRLLTTRMYPELPEPEAMYRLGQEYMRGLEQTLVGKAIFTLGRLTGPRKMLERMTRNVRTANNYMESVLEPLPDGTYRLHYRVVPALLPAMQKLPPPSVDYFHGILDTAVRASGAKAVSVTVESYDQAKREAIFRVAYS